MEFIDTFVDKLVGIMFGLFSFRPVHHITFVMGRLMKLHVPKCELCVIHYIPFLCFIMFDSVVYNQHLYTIGYMILMVSAS